eukprot:14192033-Heterocapsa_arctica.AAC.1
MAHYLPNPRAPEGDWGMGREVPEAHVTLLSLGSSCVGCAEYHPHAPTVSLGSRVGGVRRRDLDPRSRDVSLPLTYPVSPS